MFEKQRIFRAIRKEMDKKSRAEESEVARAFICPNR